MALTWTSISTLPTTTVEESVDLLVDSIDASSQTDWTFPFTNAASSSFEDSSSNYGYGFFLKRATDNRHFYWHYRHGGATTHTFTDESTLYDGVGDGSASSDYDLDRQYTWTSGFFNNGLWSSRSDFLGQRVQVVPLNNGGSGTFQRGETVTFSGGAGTATVRGFWHTHGGSRNAFLFIDGSNLNTSNLANRTVTGGSSSASWSVPNVSPVVTALHQVEEAANGNIYVSGNAIPAVTDVVTGGTSSASGIVSIQDVTTGELGFTSASISGQPFWLHGESISWPPSGSGLVSQTEYKYVAGACRLYSSAGKIGLASGGYPVLWGYDADRFIALIPRGGDGAYTVFLAGKWTTSTRGYGALDLTGIIETTDDKVDGYSKAAFVLDENGWIRVLRPQASVTAHGSNPPFMPNQMVANTGQSTTSTLFRTLGHSTGAQNYGHNWVYPLLFQDPFVDAPVAISPYIGWGPASASWRDESQGGWTGSSPVMLSLNDAGLVLMDWDGSVTP